MSFCGLACLGAYLWRSGLGEPKKTGAIEITEVKLSVPDSTLRPLDRKLVLVKFKRTGFKGPVILKLVDLPEGVTSFEKKLDESARQADIAVNVSDQPKRPLEQQIRVVIESEKEGVRAEAPLQIKVADMPKKVVDDKKKPKK
jgi:hypothetical protein